MYHAMIMDLTLIRNLKHDTRGDPSRITFRFRNWPVG